jgi:hypothetical protein
MVLRIALLALLLAGCKESLFDERVDQGDDVDGEIDGAPPPPIDASPNSLCPTPCVGDAFAEFSADQQGGTSGHWRYRADRRADNGLDYADLGKGVVVGGVSGWLGTGSPAPGVATCAGASDPACNGLADRLLLLPSTTTDTTLAWTAPQSGKYRVNGSLRIADGAAAGAQEKLLIARNGRHDTLHNELFTPAVVPHGFDLEIELVTGDQLLFTVKPVGAGALTPLGLHLWISGGSGFPGECTHALTFEGANDEEQLEDKCNGDAWDNDGTTSTESLAAPLGKARKLLYGQFLAATNSAGIERGGDFTIQFWFKNDEGGDEGVNLEPIYSDFDCQSQGGLWLDVNLDGDFEILYLFHEPGADYCFQLDAPRFGWSGKFTDEEWHFYRLVRSTAAGELTVCIDGEEIASTSIPANANMNSSERPHLGKNSSFGAAQTSGVYDDFRAFTRALPCESVP